MDVKQFIGKAKDRWGSAQRCQMRGQTVIGVKAKLCIVVPVNEKDIRALEWDEIGRRIANEVMEHLREYQAKIGAE